MFRFFQKHKFHLLATLLCVFMCLSFGVFSVYAPKVAFAEDSLEDYVQPEELMEYYTNGGYSEAEADQFARELEVAFGEAISIESGYIVFEPDSVEPTMDNHEELVGFITANVNAINQLVAEGVGYVDEYGEFQPTISDDDIMRVTQWSFKLKWNRVTATFGGRFAVITSLFFMFIKVVLGAAQFFIEDAISYITDKDLLRGLITSILENSSSTVADHLENKLIDEEEETLSNIVVIATTFYEVCSSYNLYLKVIAIIMSLLLPSSSDCAIVLYNSLFFDRGAKLVGCWFPTRTSRLGVSLSVI